jgi:D-alanyl-D-alanine-carboxypeptidase/D-alanyl-D-alanine-endopeptidase
MKRPHRFVLVGILLASLVLEATVAQSHTPIPSDPEIRSILAERIDKNRQSVGIVVGVIEPQGRRIVSYGKLDAGDSRPLNGDTVFEIGSITKVFTSLVLADMVERKEIGLLDAVTMHLPPGTKVPELDREEITLHDLATHTSGLPRMPLNVDPLDPDNPYAEYTPARLYDFLARYQLQRAVGARFEYSNLGEALLGQALAQRSKMNYDDMVRRRISDPLGMKSTGVALTPAMKDRLAPGHAYALERTPNWDLSALEPAAGLRSTANDLLNFLSAHIGLTQTPLAPAMKAMTKVRRTVSGRSVALGWFVENRDDVSIIYHSGGTGGYMSFIGYDAQARRGVVVLSNTGVGAGIDDIGFHLLSRGSPLLQGKAVTPAKERKEVTIDAKVLDTFVGAYEFPSEQLATITRVGNRLHLQGVGDARIIFYPESDRAFFAKLIDAQISFTTNARGVVTGLIYSRSGEDLRVRRID